MPNESTSGSTLSEREQAALAEEDSLVASQVEDESIDETLTSPEAETSRVAGEHDESTETESEAEETTESEETTKTDATTVKAGAEESTETESADEPVEGETPEQKAARKSRTARRIEALLGDKRSLSTKNAEKDAEIAQLRTKLQAQIAPATATGGSQIPKAHLNQTVAQMLAESQDYRDAVTQYNAARASGDEQAQANAWGALESEKRAIEFAAFERVQSARIQHSSKIGEAMDEMLEVHRDYPFIIEREGKFDVDTAAPIMVAATQLAAAKGKQLNPDNLLLYLNKAARNLTASNGVNQVMEKRATEAKNRDLERRTVLESGSRAPGKVTPQAVKRERELIAKAKTGDKSARRALAEDAIARDFKM